MIKVFVELWPFGQESKKRPLGEMTIFNDGTGTKTRGNYVFRIFGKSGKLLREGKVDNYPRLAYNVFELLKRILNTKKDESQTD